MDKSSLRIDNVSGSLAFRVSIGTGENEDRAIVTIGHESFVHVEKNTNDFEQLVSDYKNGAIEKEADEKGVSKDILFIVKIANLQGDESDHKLFVNGKVSSYENFIKEL